jgi:hypothetical protein
MKKITVLFFLFFIFLTFFLFAQDNEITWNYEEKIRNSEITPDRDVVWIFDTVEKEEVVEKKVKEKGPFRIPNRNFETGILNLNLGASNSFMSTFEIFKEKVTIDIDKLSNGLNINTNLFLSPVFFNFNKKDKWGYGLSTGLEVFGIADLNGNMLTLHEADSANSDIGAGVFAEVNVHGFLTFQKFKIKVKPAVYYPLLYAIPKNFSYTYANKNEGGIDNTYLNMELDMRVFTPFPLDKDFDFKDIFDIFSTIKDTITDISARPGIDISIGAEYPLSEVLGLTEKISFLDFDVGIDFINIPLYRSVMEDYIPIIANLGNGDEPIDFFNELISGDSEEIDFDKYFNYTKGDPGKDKINITRPFKMIISANWRPFGSPFKSDSNEINKQKREWLTFTPMLGFAVNPIYFKPFSLEGGIKTRFSFVNFFIAALNIGYYDRLWKNSLDLAVNLRIFEIDIGASMQSADFLKSWSGGGFGASFGLKFGW